MQGSGISRRCLAYDDKVNVTAQITYQTKWCFPYVASKYRIYDVARVEVFTQTYRDRQGVGDGSKTKQKAIIFFKYQITK